MDQISWGDVECLHSSKRNESESGEPLDWCSRHSSSPELYDLVALHISFITSWCHLVVLRLLALSLIFPLAQLCPFLRHNTVAIQSFISVPPIQSIIYQILLPSLTGSFFETAALSNRSLFVQFFLCLANSFFVQRTFVLCIYLV